MDAQQIASCELLSKNSQNRSFGKLEILAVLRLYRNFLKVYFASANSKKLLDLCNFLRYDYGRAFARNYRTVKQKTRLTAGFLMYSARSGSRLFQFNIFSLRCQPIFEG